jgi:hypothetical protein
VALNTTNYQTKQMQDKKNNKADISTKSDIAE